MVNRHSGFSLVEIVLALGILSFAIVAILGLFPIAMNDARESKNETHAAMIAQLILGQLRSQPADASSFPVGTNATDGNATTGNWGVDLKDSVEYCAFYSDAGEPLRRATPAQYTSGDVPAAVSKAAYKVRMKVEPEVPRAGLSKVTIDVSYPCAVPLENRRSFSFVTLSRNQE